jgi:hypothetical protein
MRAWPRPVRYAIAHRFRRVEFRPAVFGFGAAGYASRMRYVVMALALSGVLATSVAPLAAAETTAGSKVYALAAQNGSGENGTVGLTPQGSKTIVTVLLTGVPSTTPQPAHVHVGPCSKLDPAPKYPLAPVVDGVSVTTLDVPMATLTAGTLAVNVHKSADDIKTYVACGDLK